MLIRSLFLSSLVLSSNLAFSISALEVKQIVADTDPDSYTRSNHGKLCEIIGVQAMQELRPNATIMNGVEYKKNGRVIGELDLVIVENGRADEVIEVKCMKSFGSAAHKADEQLDRFRGYIGHCDIDFSLQGDAVPCDVFAGPEITTKKMSYADALSHGFDYDIGVTRQELLELIDKL